MSIRAIIAAGGKGSRLYPVTGLIPKPMAPVLSRPTIEYIFSLLAHNGISHSGVTTGYLAEVIESRYPDAYRGMKLTYFRESSPLGTAGGLVDARSFLDEGDESFVFICGDAICDYDISEAVRFHRDNGSDCTILLAKSSSPTEYGVVMCGTDGRIKRFAEKPDWSGVFSNRINTGIYILNRSVIDYIPVGKAFDFSKNLFPLLLKENKRLFGLPVSGYWCDMGSLSDYYKCNFDAHAGKFKSYVDIRPSEYSFTKDNSIICSGARIGDGARVSSSIVGSNAHIGKNSLVRGSIICPDATVENECVIPDGCVIGGGASVHAGTILPRCRLIPAVSATMRNGSNKSEKTESGITSSLSPFAERASARYEAMRENGIQISPSGTSPMPLIAAGSALSKLDKISSVTVTYSEGMFASAYALECGALWAGLDVIDLGIANFALSSFAAEQFSLPCAHVFQDGSSVMMVVFDSDGLYISSAAERKICSAAYEPELSALSAFSSAHFQTLVTLQDSYLLYLQRDLSDSSLIGREIYLRRSMCAELLKKALNPLGARCEFGDGTENIFIDISDDGTKCRMMSYGEEICDFDALRAVLIRSMPKFEECNYDGSCICLPSGAPIIFDYIAAENGFTVKRFPSHPSEKLHEKDSLRPWLRDGAFCAARLIKLLKLLDFDLEAFRAMLDSLPRFSRAEAELPEPKNKAELLFRLSEKYCRDGFLEEGIEIPLPGGIVRVTANRARGIKILSEAVSSEIAGELCSFVRGEIMEINRNDNKKP
ncbi:MAG: sugar phosphate nucleotidyltransferase [Oscillospiraceae bacterium]|nr:sugar phosphate nucleotidyltransferase [Oscillospiraceae bacterium]